MPPPVGALSVVAVTRTSVSVDDTPVRKAEGPVPAVAIDMLPVPPPTVTRDPLPVVHGPPVSAVPQPLDVVRENTSDAYNVIGGAVTVTGAALSSVAPRLSVTVSVTV